MRRFIITTLQAGILYTSILFAVFGGLHVGEQEFLGLIASYMSRLKQLGDGLGSCKPYQVGEVYASESEIDVYIPYYKLIARHSGKCAEVEDGGTGDGANIQQWELYNPPYGIERQRWIITEVNGNQDLGFGRVDSYYFIKNVLSKKYMNVYEGNTDDGANIYQWSFHGGNNQQWKITPVGEGYYKICARHSGKCMDVYEGHTDDGANIHQWSFHGGNNQQWELKKCPIEDDALFMGYENVPTTMIPGEQRTVRITIKNNSTTTWTYDGNFKLGSQNPQDNDTWGLGRVLLNPDESIAPGHEKIFEFTIIAPDTEGVYNFQWRMLQEYITWFGDYTPNVEITVGSSPSCQPNEWKMEIWDNMDLSGDPIATRCEPPLNAKGFEYYWGLGGPVDGLVDNFSVRFTRDVNFGTGTYTFAIHQDDGSRLYIDGDLILDRWNDPPDWYYVDVNLTGGEHTIMLEYFENTGGAYIKLDWEGVSPPPNDILSYMRRSVNQGTLHKTEGTAGGCTPIVSYEEELFEPNSGRLFYIKDTDGDLVEQYQWNDEYIWLVQDTSWSTEDGRCLPDRWDCSKCTQGEKCNCDIWMPCAEETCTPPEDSNDAYNAIDPDGPGTEWTPLYWARRDWQDVGDVLYYHTLIQGFNHHHSGQQCNVEWQFPYKKETSIGQTDRPAKKELIYKGPKDWGGNISNVDSIGIKYCYNYDCAEAYEIHWYALGYGWVSWEHWVWVDERGWEKQKYCIWANYVEGEHHPRNPNCDPFPPCSVSLGVLCPIPPTLNVPEDHSVISSGPTLSWTDNCEDDDGYEVNLVGSAMNWTSPPLTSTSIDVSGLPFKTGNKYTWKVRYWYLNCPQYDTWSSSKSFWWNLDRPVLVSPENSLVVSSAPVLDWGPYEGAGRYQVKLSGAGIGNYRTFPLRDTFFNTSGLGDLFSMGEEYAWKVRACFAWNSLNCTSYTSWTDPYTFWWKQLDRPVLISPPNGSSVASGPVFHWDSYEGATAYKLRITGGINWTSFPLTDTSYDATGKFNFHKGEQYTWKVKACYNTDCSSHTPWSDAYTFMWRPVDPF